MSITVTRIHEICAGHRVYGHEGKCKYLHGHQYKFEFTLRAENGLDSVGRVIDFSVIKLLLCAWLEDNWDHKLLLWDKDPMLLVFDFFKREDVKDLGIVIADYTNDPSASVVRLPINPTAENIAQHITEDIAPELLKDKGVQLLQTTVWETSKCCATYSIKEFINNVEATSSLSGSECIS